LVDVLGTLLLVTVLALVDGYQFVESENVLLVVPNQEKVLFAVIWKLSKSSFEALLEDPEKVQRR
jgi:hypothetical protein